MNINQWHNMFSLLNIAAVKGDRFVA